VRRPKAHRYPTFQSVKGEVGEYRERLIEFLGISLRWNLQKKIRQDSAALRLAEVTGVLPQVTSGLSRSKRYWMS
jgi:hypothetical protein